MAGKRIPKHKVTIRTLWGIAKSPELQLGSEELHLVVQAQTGKDSLKELTEPERRRVAYVLGQMKESASGKRKRPVGMTGNATDNQRRHGQPETQDLHADQGAGLGRQPEATLRVYPPDVQGGTGRVAEL